nr:uncharacterized protein LOC131769632 isoform X2 [Pocillopora verrucosa]
MHFRKVLSISDPLFTRLYFSSAQTFWQWNKANLVSTSSRLNWKTFSVRVGRNFVQEHDVVVSYINPGLGRGGFRVSRGSIRSEVPISGGRRLTIGYSIGNNFKSFEITRSQGGD